MTRTRTFPEVRVRAAAKINLALHVTGRRGDGYHTLSSLVAFADVGDEIAAETATGIELAITGPFAPALGGDDDNLVLRAARGLRDRAGDAAMGAALRLIKNLPVASGIGGGSADAAATLRAFARLWSIDIDMTALALSLGADVPVCLGGRAVLMAGVGEDLSPIPPLPPAHLLLVNPGLALSTPAVFAARQGPFSAPLPPPPAFKDAAALADWLGRCRNDLEPPAKSLAPAISEVLAELRAAPGCLLARMSGSGATCFALFAAPAPAHAARSEITARRPDWWTAAAALLSDANEQ